MHHKFCRYSVEKKKFILPLNKLFNLFLESWLKAFSDEPKPKKKKKKKSGETNQNEDSLSVLDAAGLTGRQFSWTKGLSSKIAC